MMKVYLKRVFTFLIIAVLMLNTVFVQPADANAALLPAAAVGYTISALAMLGIVFAFNDYDDVIDGINTVVNKFISTKEDIEEAYNEMFAESDIMEFISSGVMTFTNPEFWNEFVDWFVGGGADEDLGVLNPMDGVYILGGVYIYLIDTPSTYTFAMYNSKALSIYGEVIKKDITPSSINTKDNPYYVIENSTVWSIYKEGLYIYTQDLDGRIGRGGSIDNHYNACIFYDFIVDAFYLSSGGSLIEIKPDAKPLTYQYLKNAIGASTLNPPWDLPQKVGRIPDTKTGSEEQEKEKERYLPYPKKWWQDKTGEEAIDDVIEGVGTGQIAVPGIDELVGSIDDAIPIEESMTWGMAKPEDFDTPNLTNVFPFCIPFDLIALVGALNARAEVPIFKIPVNMSFAGYQGEMVVDLSEWEPVARVIRWGTTIFFVLGLIIVTRKMIQG